MERAFLSSSLLDKKIIAQDILEARLSKPKDFSYAAGQFIQVAVPSPDGSILRCYSLSSTPDQPDLELCVKLFPQGVGSEFFRALEIGHSLEFSRPRGKFTVGEANKPMVFVATGVGLAPIISMISDELINKRNAQPIYLLFGIRGEGDVFWTERLRRLTELFPNFSFNLTLSQPKANWPGLQGRVTNFLDALKTDAEYYVCGSVDMVKDVRAALLNRGEPATAIHFEIF